MVLLDGGTVKPNGESVVAVAAEQRRPSGGGVPVAGSTPS